MHRLRATAEAFPFAWCNGKAGELAELFATQLFVALFDRCGGLGFQIAKNLKQLRRIKRLKLIVRFRAAREAWGRDHDDWHILLNLLDLASHFRSGEVVQPAVEDDAVDSRKSVEDLQGLFAAVRRKNVELGSFDHELARRDAARKLPVDDKKTRPDHAKH